MLKLCFFWKNELENYQKFMQLFLSSGEFEIYNFRMIRDTLRDCTAAVNAGPELPSNSVKSKKE